MAEERQDATPPEVNRTAQRIGVGCFTAVVGFAAGGMLGVFAGWAYAFLTRAPKCTGIPSCDWGYWATAGAWIGLVTLPAISLWRLRGAGTRTEPDDRG
jgi:hypothetical protein